MHVQLTYGAVRKSCCALHTKAIVLCKSLSNVVIYVMTQHRKTISLNRFKASLANVVLGHLEHYGQDACVLAKVQIKND